MKVAAAAAIGQHDWASVSEWATRLRTTFPKERDGYELGLRAARALNRKDDIERITRIAANRFPRQAWTIKAQALLAMRQGDWRTAEGLAAALRARFNHVAGYEIGVAVLGQMRRIDKARTLLKEGLDRFPEGVELRRWRERLAKWDDFARTDAILRNDSGASPADLGKALKFALHSDNFVNDFFGGREETLRRLNDLQALHGRAPRLVAAHGRALADLGRFEEAEAALSDSDQQATSPDIALAWADLAEKRGDGPMAVSRYTDVRTRFPDDRRAHLGLVRNLTAVVQNGGADRRNEAEAAAEDALSRFPDSKDLYDLHAWIAYHAGDLPTALERWSAAHARFPDAAHKRFNFRTRVLDATLAVGDAPMSEEARKAITDPIPEASGLQHDLAPAELVARFQNLGSTVFGCEFGIVQRHFGAEPLHLLRWSACPLPSLIKLIECDFEGFTDAEDTRLDIQASPRSGDEYMFRSLRYALRLDTFVPVTDIPREQAATQIRRRTAFLVRKLREELSRPDPTDKTLFVYKAYDEHVSDEDILALVRALNKHGPNTLLCVRRATKTEPAGMVEQTAPNLFTGYLPEFGKTAVGVGLSTQHDAWLTILSRTYDLWCADQQATSAT